MKNKEYQKPAGLWIPLPKDNVVVSSVNSLYVDEVSVGDVSGSVIDVTDSFVVDGGWAD